MSGRTLADMGRRTGFRLFAAGAACLAMALAPATASAHPLGNFTINHYAALTIRPDGIAVDLVIDMAEIPAFQERQTMDSDGDGSVSDVEGTSWAAGACVTLEANLQLARGGAPLALTPGPSSVGFPPGAGGLSTLRLECAYEAPLTTPISGPTVITFADTSYTERIGWREILAAGDGTIVDTHGLPSTSPSQKLTAYPAELIKVPLDIRSATVHVRPAPAGRAASGAPTGSSAPVGAGPISSTPGGGVAGAAAVPGGVAADLPDIFRTTDLTPLVILGSLLTAVVIGAGHALTPGHGKTLMAAYLVGSRGTAVHAVGLGLSVAVSHTIGILTLALIIVGAGSILPPDVVYRVTPVVAGASIIAIGGWMLFNEVRRRRTGRSLVTVGEGPGAHEHAPIHEHAPVLARAAEPSTPVGHEHGDGEHRHDHDGLSDAPHGHDHQALGHHDQPHDHDHPHDPEASPAHAEPVAGEHSHGGIRHSHLPPAGTTLSWRGLFVLGLAGGLIPSTSALLILLGSIAAGRPAFGLVLVVAFGLGMAAVMTGVGLAMIVARTRLDRMPSRSSLGRLAAIAPLVASIAVLGLGVVLTWQAVAGTPVL